jgi:hypothetical protein
MSVKTQLNAQPPSWDKRRFLLLWPETAVRTKGKLIADMPSISYDTLGYTRSQRVRTFSLQFHEPKA